MDAISSLMLQEGWRKGPWTALEDRLLTEYVQQYGEGSWNSVAKLTGMCVYIQLICVCKYIYDAKCAC